MSNNAETTMGQHGFVRVGVAVPTLKVANVEYNTQEIIKQILNADQQGVQILTFPELSLTGYTCGDLFHQDLLLTKSKEGLKTILQATTNDIVSIIGMPLMVDNQLFNVGVVIQTGKILGVVPKTYIPNYNEFYEKRWFASSVNALSHEIDLLGEQVPFGTQILFQDKTDAGLCFGVEICEDARVPISPSAYHTQQGATMTFNLSASNEVVGKDDYRKNLIKMLSAKHLSAYVYASSGMGESTTDMVFWGTALIAENGTLLKEGTKFSLESQLTIADIDTKKLMHERLTTTSYRGVENSSPYQKIPLSLQNKNTDLMRQYAKYPFVPSNENERMQRCNEIITIQATGLAKRLQHTGISKTVIGISWGLDSTLAFLVIDKAYELLGIERKNSIAITMPGFGTTDRTYQNALNLITSYGATLKEISIKDACIQHFRDIGHDENIHDITYENTQARERTQILMDVANQEGALVIGTGDLSELALGRCTYNGDHMSMYAVNTSIPKTLVRYLVEYVAQTTNNPEITQTINDILATPISPELLPPDQQGNIQQKTEHTVGPYVLHDFFLYHFMRYGASPKKILDIATRTFQGEYERETIKHWLKKFITRFFSQQFKRSCLPDGPKVWTVSLSPRGDWRMPSDAECAMWLEEMENC